MKTSNSNTLSWTLDQEHTTNALENDIQHFYDEATEDYSFWSKDLNMHFGYFDFKRTNLFRRDSMLNELNRRALKALKLPEKNPFVVDLGCGMGATMRYFLKNHPNLKTIGVTLSEFQVKEGNQLLKDKNGLILLENYEQTSIESGAAHGVIAMESLCHSGHSYASLKEGYRLLKKGGRLLITDAFLKRSVDSLCYGSKYSYKQLCKGWSLDGLGQIDRVKNDLKQIGFSNVYVKDISFNVAPSVLHVPFAIIGFLIKKLLKKQPIKPQSWNNLRGSLYALISGLHLKDFGYYQITAIK